MISIEQIKELQQRVETLGRCIAVEAKREEVAKMQEKTLAADFWDDPKEAEKFLKEMSGVKFWVTGFDKVAAAVDDLNVLMISPRRAFRMLMMRIQLRWGNLRRHSSLHRRNLRLLNFAICLARRVITSVPFLQSIPVQVELRLTTGRPCL